MVEAITIIIFAVILLIGFIIAFYLGRKFGHMQRDKYWEDELPNQRQDAIMRSRTVLGGHFSEQLAPFLPDFEYLPSEARFIGKPVDLLIFEGLDNKKIEKVTFLEIKSGKAQLSPIEKNLKEVIEKGKVEWKLYRIPQSLTEKGNIAEKVQEIVDDVKFNTKKFFCEMCGGELDGKGKCIVCKKKKMSKSKE